MNKQPIHERERAIRRKLRQEAKDLEQAKAQDLRRLNEQKSDTNLPVSLCQSCYRDEGDCPCKAVPFGPK